jgi:hypothetical protein
VRKSRTVISRQRTATVGSNCRQNGHTVLERSRSDQILLVLPKTALESTDGAANTKVIVTRRHAVFGKRQALTDADSFRTPKALFSSSGGSSYTRPERA